MKRALISGLGGLLIISLISSLKVTSKQPLSDTGSCTGERFLCRATLISEGRNNLTWEDNNTKRVFFTERKGNTRLGLTHIIEVSSKTQSNVFSLESATPISQNITLFCSTRVPKNMRTVLPGPSGELDFYIPTKVELPRRNNHSFGKHTHFLFNGTISGRYITPEEAKEYGMSENCPQILRVNQ